MQSLCGYRRIACFVVRINKTFVLLSCHFQHKQSNTLIRIEMRIAKAELRKAQDNLRTHVKINN